jgi:hypothetical protein
MTTAAVWWTYILECCAGREVAPRGPKAQLSCGLLLSSHPPQ